MKNIIIMVIIVLIFSGCSSVIKIQESFREANYDYSLIRNSNIKFAGTNRIFLKEFINTFKDEYSDTNKLNNKLYD